jgi:hypothetical protein
MRRWFTILALLGLTNAAGAQPAPLYQAQVIVTGTDMRERPAGLSRCLMDVLVKVSGDPALPDNPRAQALGARAPELIEDFDYRDRMGHLPMQDEQGSRDRPYTLTCRFVPARVDAALRSIGSRPWRGPRPRLLAEVTMTDRSGNTLSLKADLPQGDGPRAALLDAAEQSGLRVTLPREGAPPLRNLVQLEGVLVWHDSAFGWVADWKLTWRQQTHTWRVQGVSYDDAMRSAMRGAAAILSGNAPRTAPAR